MFLALEGFYNMIPKWLLIALVVGLGLTTCAERNLEQNLQVEFSNFKTTVAKADADRAETARKQSEDYRGIELKRFSTAQENANVVAKEKTQIAVAVAADTTARGVFTRTVAELVAPVQPGPLDPEAVRRLEARAAGLGELLGSCEAMAVRGAEETERLATQVRGLLRAYNSLLVASVGLPLLDDWAAPDAHFLTAGRQTHLPPPLGL